MARLIRSYRCPLQRGGCGLSIDAAPVEGQVRARVLALLADPDTRQNIGERNAALNDARTVAADRVAEIEEQLVDLETKLAMGEVIPKAYAAAKPVLDRRREAALAELDQVGTPSPGSGRHVARTRCRRLGGRHRRAAATRDRPLGLTITVSPTLPDGPRNTVDLRRIVIEP